MRGGLLGLAWLAGVNCRAPLLSLAPLLPLAMRDLGLSFTLAGLVTGLPLLLMGLLSVPGGWLADRFGARRTVAVASLGIAAAALGRAVAPGGAVLVVATVLLGGSIGVAQPALSRLVREAWPHRVRVASAVYFNGLLMGGIGSVALTPLLLPWLGPGGENWRAALLLWTAVAGVSAAGWLWVGHRDRPPAARGSGSLGLGPLRASAAIPGVPALAVALGTQSAIFYSLSNWLPSYLAQRGWALDQIALPLALLTVGVLAAGPTSAPVGAAIGHRAAIALSGLGVAAGLGVFLVWPDQTAWLCGLLVGYGTTVAFGIALAAPAEIAPPERVGTTAGFMLAVAYLEAAGGPAAMGVLRDYFGGYEAGWWLMLALAGVLAGSGLGVPSGRARRLRTEKVEARAT